MKFALAIHGTRGDIEPAAAVGVELLRRGHSVCTADSGPAKGMILSAGAGDDEQIMFNTEVKQLRPNAMLPGIVFETDRQWKGAD